MTNLYLLDTCAIIWTMQGATISDEAKNIVSAASKENQLFASPISAWEIGLLTARNRIAISMPPEVWFDKFITHPFVSLATLLPPMLIQSSFLPGSPPNDPADRIILSTARELDMTIITRDKIILDYADAGYAKALKC